MSNEIHGERSYLVLADETAWGVVPGEPAYVHLPVTEYSVAFVRERRAAAAFLGIRQRKHGRNFRGQCSGRLETALYGWRPAGLDTSLAQYLLDWVFGAPEEIDLPSKLAEWAEGPDVANVRHQGLRVASATLEGSATTGAVTLSLELIGQCEAAVETAQPLPDNRHRLVELEFADCEFSLGGEALGLSAFRVQIQNSLRPLFLNGTMPALLPAGSRLVTAQFTPIKNSDDWGAAQRVFDDLETTGQIVLRAWHGGTGETGTFAVGTFDFPRLAFVATDDRRSLNDLVFQTLRFEALKPDTANPDVTLTWTEE